MATDQLVTTCSQVLEKYFKFAGYFGSKNHLDGNFMEIPQYSTLFIPTKAGLLSARVEGKRGHWRILERHNRFFSTLLLFPFVVSSRHSCNEAERGPAGRGPAQSHTGKTAINFRVLAASSWDSRRAGAKNNTIYIMLSRHLTSLARTASTLNSIARDELNNSSSRLF